jgi:hypothetical protein
MFLVAMVAFQLQYTLVATWRLKFASPARFSRLVLIWPAANLNADLCGLVVLLQAIRDQWSRAEIERFWHSLHARRVRAQF